jgi:DNA-binding CsgD family transcriptional regulator
MPVVTPCRGHAILFFTPDHERIGGARYNYRVDRARELCYDCPRMLACRDEGRTLRAEGVWGAEDDLERATALGLPPQKITRPPAQPGPDCGDPGGAARHRRNNEKPCTRCLATESAAARDRQHRYELRMPGRGPEILLLMEEGLRGPQIAARTHLSLKTIHRYQRSMRLILGTKSAGLVVAARAAGIIPPLAVVELPEQELAA